MSVPWTVTSLFRPPLSAYKNRLPDAPHSHHSHSSPQPVPDFGSKGHWAKMFRRNNATTGTSATTAKGSRATPGSFRLGVWLRLHGVDLITMLLAGVAGLGIYFAPPAYDRWFPIQFQDGEIVWPEVAAPMQKEIVPIWLAAFLAFTIPFVFFCCYQIRLRNVEHLFTTTMGLLKSLITAALFQVIIKCLIGGLRPHFLIVCNPSIPQGLVGSGYQQLYFTRSVCQGDKKDINDAVESLPSGHATAAFAGFIYFSLYLNAQLKLLSAHNPAYWKMLLFMAPILGAVLIALAMTLDSYHHWYDILIGGLIGSFCALVAFRSTFASVWDFRFNHVLLPRTTSLFLRRPMQDAGALTFGYELGEGVRWPVVTREGGWGDVQEQLGGAPFDASAMRTRAGFGGGGGMGGHHGAASRHSGDASTAV